MGDRVASGSTLAEAGAPVLHVLEVVCRRRQGDGGVTAPTNSYSMIYRGEAIGESASPLCEAARILLARGLAKSEDRIATARNGVIALSASVKWAAGHVALENRRKSPQWAKWPPFDQEAFSRRDVAVQESILGVAATPVAQTPAGQP